MRGPIAIDYTAALEQGGGIGRYVRELVTALSRIDSETPYRLFAAGRRDTVTPVTSGPNFTLHTSQISPEWFARLWHRARLPLPIENWVGPVRLLYAPDFTLPPTRRGTKTLLTVHDLSFVRAPETATPGLRAYLSRVVPRSVARADHILADSESTRRDLLDLYHVEAERTSVLYSGVEGHFRPVRDERTLADLRSRYALDGSFLLAVGTVQPRKNYIRLVEAFRQLDRANLTLVIAGGRGWLDDPLYERIAALGLENRVRMLGFVPDKDLPALYSAARVFAFPSLYEGFGLPILEAMACGTPVVTSRASSMPEVAGDAALLVDPLDTDALAEALASALDDELLRSSLIEKGLERATVFTWEAAAHKLVDRFQRLLAQ